MSSVSRGEVLFYGTSVSDRVIRVTELFDDICSAEWACNPSEFVYSATYLMVGPTFLEKISNGELERVLSGMS